MYEKERKKERNKKYKFGAHSINVDYKIACQMLIKCVEKSLEQMWL